MARLARIPSAIVLLLAMAGGSACGSNDPPGERVASGGPEAGLVLDAGAPSVVVAQAADFSGFCSWHSAPATPAKATPMGIHGVNPMTVYWKTPPPHGATEFPVGTMILKESNEATATSRVVFAMVKRQSSASGYNDGGAPGWEWFSLQDQGDCTVMVLWRGPAPPVLVTYSDLLTGDCNGCHSQMAASDYVWDTALQLPNF